MEMLAGKTALITGGASGIGLGMARAFVQAGLQVAIADINAAALEAATAALPGLGAAVKLDVTLSAEWEHALDTVEAALGPVEILCNNAGVGQGRFADGREITVAEMPEPLWRMVLEINVTGTFLGARTVLPRMLARRQWGHIVNTASTGGLMAPAGIAAYCASKFAVVGLSESLRAELAPAGIGVSVLCPGGVRSNLFASSVAVRAAVPGAAQGMATVGSEALRIEQAQRKDRVRGQDGAAGDRRQRDVYHSASGVSRPHRGTARRTARRIRFLGAARISRYRGDVRAIPQSGICARAAVATREPVNGGVDEL